jgi:hypothetical protein
MGVPKTGFEASSKGRRKTFLGVLKFLGGVIAFLGVIITTIFAIKQGRNLLSQQIQQIVVIIQTKDDSNIQSKAQWQAPTVVQVTLSTRDYSHSEAQWQVQSPPQQLLQPPPKAEIKNSVVDFFSEIKDAAEIHKYYTSFSIAFSPDISDINIIKDYDVYKDMEEMAVCFKAAGSYRKAALCYYWLSRQTDMDKNRRKGNEKSFVFLSSLWEFSDDFVDDIAQGRVTAVVNSDGDGLRLRQYHEIVDDNIIGRFSTHEKITVLERSALMDTIGDLRAYWYQVCTADGRVGWTFGWFLSFYPIFP